MELMKRLINEEEGQGLVEYALIIGLIAVAAIAAMELLGGNISKAWTAIAGKITTP